MRRVAVFVGYGHPEPGPAWSRVTRRGADRREAAIEPDHPSAVIQLEPVARLADMQRAA